MNLTTKSQQSIHPIGIGTWNIGSQVNPANIGDMYKGVEARYGHEDQEIDAIRYSIERGQNHLDCAQLYGRFYTDEIVGKALAGLERENLFIADKIWKTSVGVGLVKPTVEKMLHKLGTNYLDMLYIHAPWEGVAWQEAIPQIDALIDEGVVRYFGVSNFNVAQMQAAQSLSGHQIAANQMEYNVLHTHEVDEDFRSYCAQRHIQIVAYRPIKRREVLGNNIVCAIAEAHQATPAQVALAWLIQMDTLPIPKSTQRAHIDENLRAIELKLTEAEIQALGKIDVP